MPADLFDLNLRAMRRDRAFRAGSDLFLCERAFEDCLERIGLVNRRFQSALLIGCPDAGWPRRLNEHAAKVEGIEPGARFAHAAGGEQVVEDRWPGSPGHDLCVAVGTLDTVNNLPQVLFAIRQSLTSDALFIGAMAGGETLPELRNAMRAADRVTGTAVAHVHPRIEPSALSSLLSAAGFANPVVDVDRVRASYESLDRLVADLRAMGVTNVLRARSRIPLLKAECTAAALAFAAAGENGRTTETFEILHFAGWTPSAQQEG
jgi:hypothetical protein